MYRVKYCVTYLYHTIVGISAAQLWPKWCHNQEAADVFVMDRSTVHSKESLWFELQKVGEHGVKGLRKYFESIGRWACVTAAEGGHPKYWSQRLNKNSRTRFIWHSHWNHASCTEISSIFRIQYLTQKRIRGQTPYFVLARIKWWMSSFLAQQSSQE